MDLQMPVMDGYDATKEIRALQKRGEIKHCYIVCISANTSSKDKVKSLAIGMDDFGKLFL